MRQRGQAARLSWHERRRGVSRVVQLRYGRAVDTTPRKRPPQLIAWVVLCEKQTRDWTAPRVRNGALCVFATRSHDEWIVKHRHQAYLPPAPTNQRLLQTPTAKQQQPDASMKQRPTTVTTATRCGSRSLSLWHEGGGATYMMAHASQVRGLDLLGQQWPALLSALGLPSQRCKRTQQCAPHATPESFSLRSLQACTLRAPIAHPTL